MGILDWQRDGYTGLADRWVYWRMCIQMCKYWIVRETGILDYQREQYTVLEKRCVLWIVREMGILDYQREE